MATRLTLSEVKRRLVAEGIHMSLTRPRNYGSEEIRVAFFGKNSESSASYTDDPEDALGTAREMWAWKLKQNGS